MIVAPLTRTGSARIGTCNGLGARAASSTHTSTACSTRKCTSSLPSCRAKLTTWPAESGCGSPRATGSCSTQRRLLALLLVTVRAPPQHTSSMCVREMLKRRMGSGSQASKFWGWWCRPTGVAPSGTSKSRSSGGRDARSSGESPSACTQTRRQETLRPAATASAGASALAAGCGCGSSAAASTRGTARRACRGAPGSRPPAGGESSETPRLAKAASRKPGW
mmetsp:Transcript_104928/g.338358  ORF Transcript_104928/g.338358 Transcript_104928/m.338358 type:complete len:222 (-) Transcript_104928:878-1543(-)